MITEEQLKDQKKYDKIYLIEYETWIPCVFDETEVSCKILASSKKEALRIFKEEVVDEYLEREEYDKQDKDEWCYRIKDISLCHNPKNLNADSYVVLFNKEPNWTI